MIVYQNYYKKHICIQNSLKSLCPICMEFLHSSTKPVTFYKICGHPIHAHCLQLTLNSRHYNCVICRTSIFPDKVQINETS